MLDITCMRKKTINSLSNKSAMLKEKHDILVNAESKLDISYPENNFYRIGFKKPYRLERNRHGGVMLCERRYP